MEFLDTRLFHFFNAGTLDGVVLAPSTLPNGEPPYGEGKTLVHEAGHWLGLFHTFQGGCSAYSPKITKAFKNSWIMSSEGRGGDYVRDTAAEEGPYFGGCEPNMAESQIPDTCTGNLKGKFEGKDPIHNVMDYSEDECITEITDGQFENIHLFWRAFREKRNSMCFMSPTQQIADCMCHASCGSCGYYEWPIRNNDCITCADGSDVVPEFDDGTGRCEPGEIQPDPMP